MVEVACGLAEGDGRCCHPVGMYDGVAVDTDGVRPVAHRIGQAVEEADPVDERGDVLRDATARMPGAQILAEDALELGEQARDVSRLQVPVGGLEASVARQSRVGQRRLEGLPHGQEVFLDVADLRDVEVAHGSRSNP